MLNVDERYLHPPHIPMKENKIKNFQFTEAVLPPGDKTGYKDKCTNSLKFPLERAYEKFLMNKMEGFNAWGFLCPLNEYIACNHLFPSKFVAFLESKNLE